jgi:hypothetical protein
MSQEFLCQSFDMKDLGETDVILNIKLIKEENVTTLTQYHYVEKVMSRFCYMDIKHFPTPYDLSLVLQHQWRYSHIFESLMYLASATGFDISFNVSKLEPV